MRKKRGLKLLILITFFVSLFYLVFYLYSAGVFSIQASCPEQGGICKKSCSPWEMEKGSCSLNNTCCISFEGNTQTIKNAMMYRDLSMCKIIPDSLAKNACQLAVTDSINYDNALEYESSDYCELIQDASMRDLCFNDLSVKLEERDLCYEITSLQKRDTCLISFVDSLQDMPICNNLSTEYHKEVCIKTIAILAKDSSLCSQLNIYSESYDCFKTVNLKMNAPFNVNCQSFSKEECERHRGCQELIINEVREIRDVYGGCARDEKLFCRLTGGNWEKLDNRLMNIKKEGCNCPSGRSYYKGYGCYSCAIFSNEDVRKDCERNLGL